MKRNKILLFSAFSVTDEFHGVVKKKPGGICSGGNMRETERKRNTAISLCYIVIIASAICIIVFIAFLLRSSESSRYWDKNYDFLARCLTAIFTLGIIIPPLLIARIRKNK
ncbi:MAG: hypothetical protein GXZ01_00955 [Clostridiaceae bacterium]|nr:hypothetical protein [Clostridiaceae bacterium]